MNPIGALSLIREFVFPAGCAVCGIRLLDGGESARGVCSECGSLLRADLRRRCASCGRPLVSERARCLECRELPPPSFDGAHLLFAYAGTPRRLLTAFKFGQGRSAVGFAAEAFAEAIARRPEIGAEFRIVPVPPRPGKLKRNGWDQVDAIVSRLERAEGLPVSRCLVRLPGRTQKKLNRAERADNMKAAFRCVSAPPVRAVLVDDVCTTGATLNACAAALKSGGCSYVFAIAFCYD